MSVVLRCPSCGTTRPTSGECEACREADVRYYCTNHTPGVWLTAPTCSQCGARFGESARPPPTRAPAVPAPSGVARTAPPMRVPERVPSARAPLPRADPSERHSPAGRPEVEPDIWAGRDRLPAPASFALLQKLIGALVMARTASRAAPLEPERPSIGRHAGGCLVRFVLVLLFLLLLIVGAVFLFAQAWLGAF